uniref:ATP synthase-coupling factor 6, mitochondrial n=1 Tax=Panagrellus redivivus TaxID=6233 RepID=A0A7E4ZZD2_PANRE
MFRQVVAPARALSTSALRQKEDLIAGAFLKQIRDLASKQKSAGGLVNTSPEIKKSLDEQLNRLANKFKLANADVVAKLNVDFEKAQVESSVAAGLEGKSLDELIAGVKAEEAAYLKQREEKKKIEQQRLAALASAESGSANAKRA